jgi:hypothetical protein
MRKITCTDGSIALVDDDDYNKIKAYRWIRAEWTNGYVICYIKRKIVYLHRLVMNAGPKQGVDHRSRNKLDNQKGNLRFATRSQNACNSKLRCDSTSGYKGVSFMKSSSKWLAYACINNKQVNIGLFKTPKEAAIEYDKKALELYGEFARTNFPQAITGQYLFSPQG